jgi:hypothetical protein
MPHCPLETSGYDVDFCLVHKPLLSRRRFFVQQDSSMDGEECQSLQMAFPGIFQSLAKKSSSPRSRNLRSQIQLPFRQNRAKAEKGMPTSAGLPNMRQAAPQHLGHEKITMICFYL